jgi:hypothetical protein
MRLPLDMYRLSQGFSSAHPGWDLATSINTPIKAAVTGTVIQVGRNRNYIGGLYVVIRENHPDGWEYYTGHCNSTIVTVGQKVSEGQVIAYVGQTGNATGPHTHFQIRRNNYGALMNPQSVINARTPQAPTPTPPPVSTGKKVHLPAAVATWRFYGENVAPKAGNEKATLKPSKFGGLTYDVLGWSDSNTCVIIQTGQYGRGKIFVKGTVATFS